MKAALYPSFLRILRRIPAPRTLVGSVSQSIVSAFIGILAVYIYGKLEEKDVVGSLAYPFVLLGVAVVLIVFAWLRHVLDLRQGPLERRLPRVQKQFDMHLEPCGDVRSMYRLRTVKYKSPHLFRFPDPGGNDGLLRLAGELNYKAFRFSAFGDPVEKKIVRNTAHQQKNPRCLMLVGAPYKAGSGEAERSIEWIGFTHLIPVDRRVYDEYVSGRITDNDFSADDVCGLDEPAYAVLVFSIGLDRYLIKAKADQLESRAVALEGLPANGFQARNRIKATVLLEAEEHLREALSYHLRELLAAQAFDSDKVVLVAQNLNQKVVKVLRAAHFKELPKKNADQERIFEIVIKR